MPPVELVLLIGSRCAVWESVDQGEFSMTLKAKYLAGVGVVALIVAAGSLQARADDASDAILRRLDALEKENGKLRAEIKRIEAKTTQKAEPKKAAAEAWPAD